MIDVDVIVDLVMFTVHACFDRISLDVVCGRLVSNGVINDVSFSLEEQQIWAC